GHSIVQFNVEGRSTSLLNLSEAYGVFFLRHGSDGYEPVDAIYPGVLAAASAVRGDTPIDRVAHLVGALLTAADSTRSQKFDALTSREVARSHEASLALRQGLKDPDRWIQLSAAGILCRFDDLSALPIVEQALLVPDNEPAEGVAY